MTPFELVYGRPPTTMLYCLLPHVGEDDLKADFQGYLQRAEEARQLARVRTTDQQMVNAGRYNLRRRDPEYFPVERVWFGLLSDDEDSVRSFCTSILYPTGLCDVLANLTTR